MDWEYYEFLIKSAKTSDELIQSQHKLIMGLVSKLEKK